jgi:hypothetical protein
MAAIKLLTNERRRVKGRETEIVMNVFIRPK